LKRKYQISLLAVVILVMLRIGIGWHFLHEGIWKFKQPDFSARPFLLQARGPLANLYRSLIPDLFGEERLSFEGITLRWSRIEKQAAEHYGYDVKQLQEAKQLHDQRVAQYDDKLRVKPDDKKSGAKRVFNRHVRWYKEALARWRAAEAKSETHQVPYQRQRHWDDLVKLRRQAQPWLTEVDKLEEEFRQDLTQLATAQQQASAGKLPQERNWLDILENLATYSLMAMGVCLMIGFLTRLAAFGGALFLLTAVVLSQMSLPNAYPVPPPSAGHAFLINKEVIEMLVLLLISVTAVGRWGGLDYLGHRLLGGYYDVFTGFVQRRVAKLIPLILKAFSRLTRKRKNDEPDS